MANEAKSSGDGKGTYSRLLERRRSFDTFSERIAAKEEQVLSYCTTVSTQTQVDLAEAWTYISWGIDIVQHLLESKGSRKETRNLSKKFFSGMYSLVCSVQQRAPLGAAELYKRYGQCFETYLGDCVAPAIRGKTGDEQLATFIEKWNKHKILSEWMRRFFEILDRGLVAGTNHDSLSAVAVKQFKTTLFDDIKSDLVPTMLATVQRHRDGKKDRKSVQLMHDCSEIFQTMGIVEAKQFSKIKGLVNTSKATRKGKFVVMPVLKLLADSTGVGSDEVTVADELHIYLKDYEAPFLDATKKHCARLSQKWMLEDAVPTYLMQAEQMLADEKQRVAEYLHSNTEEKLIKCVVKNLLANPQQQKLLENEESGLAVQLKQDKLKNVASMFRCIKLVEDYKLDGGLQPMANIFQQWVHDTGHELIDKRTRQLRKKDPKTGRHPFNRPHDPRYVEELKALHIKCKNIVKNQLGNHPIFQKAVAEAFDGIVNHNWGRNYHTTHELLVYFCDMILKGYAGRRRLTAEQQDKIITEVLDLFECFWDKDVFLSIYRKTMCARLLADAQSSDYIERTVLSKLQLKMGAPAVQTMEAMLRDLGNVERATQDWCRYRDNKVNAKGIEKLSARLLSNQAWPMERNSTENLVLPAAIKKWEDEYTKYYTEKNPRKDITFRHDKSRVTVQGKFGTPPRPYQIMMIGPQAAVFLRFNERPKWKIADLAEACGLSLAITKAIVESFLKPPQGVPAKGGILRKFPKPGPPFTDTDWMEFNKGFKAKNNRFQLTKPIMKETSKTTIPPEVIQQRKNMIDAALVRTMKARGVLHTDELIKEAMAQVKRWHRPTKRDMKRQIESLIEKDYMVRRADEPAMLEYRA